MAVEIKIWNADAPERVATTTAVSAMAAGQIITGAIQAAIDLRGTLGIEVKAVP